MNGILADGRERVLGDRREWVVQPSPPTEPARESAREPEPEAEPEAAREAEPAPAETTAPAETGLQPGAAEQQGEEPEAAPVEPGPVPSAAQAPPQAQVPGVVIYDLPRALATAVANNREFLARRESLYRQGLSYSLARFDFGPQFNSAVSYLWATDDGGPGSHDSTVTLGASQILPTGGTLALTTSANALWPFGNPGVDDPFYSSTVGVSLRQPLLRGAGYDISHEALTQAERNLVYSIRDFELFREGFSIDIARTYYDLTSQRRTLANEDANYQAAVFDRGKSEALQRVGRNAEQEVFRARRREIEAKDQLINARAAYDRALDAFKIQLGIATTALIDIADTEPPYEPVRVDETSAVAAARHNRLDLITERQQVEDSERALHIADNGLLPDLDLVAGYGLAGGDRTLGDAGPKDGSASIALSFEVPLQRKAQRNAYRSALISLEQARRSYSLRLDQLDLDIRDALRRLKSVEERIELQKEQILQERRAVTVTEIRYESGKIENRDLIEARQAYVNAQNALIRLKVDHFIGRLSLLRDMGLFFVDDKGMWQ